MRNTLQKPCEHNFSIHVENSCNSQNFVEFYFYPCLKMIDRV